MEILCTPDKEDTLTDFFSRQGVEVCDDLLNPCIGPAINESTETDSRKIALKLKNQVARILLAWWKPAHYFYSPDTRLFYRRALRKLISDHGQLFEWPAFIQAIQIDPDAVQTKKDHPRIWFEYKVGYEFLDEVDNGQKATVTVHSFSTGQVASQTPSPKRRRHS